MKRMRYSKSEHKSTIVGFLLVLWTGLVLLGPGVARAQEVDPAAVDGQRLSGQLDETQASFRAVWGTQAGARWATEHNAEVAACYQANALSEAHFYDEALRAYADLLKGPDGSTDQPPYVSPPMHVRNRCATAGIDSTIYKKAAQAAALGFGGEAAKRLEAIVDEKLAKLADTPSPAEAARLLDDLVQASNAFAAVRSQAPTNPAGARTQLSNTMNAYPELPVPDDLTYLLAATPAPDGTADPSPPSTPAPPDSLPPLLNAILPVLAVVVFAVGAIVAWRFLVFFRVIHRTYRVAVQEFSPPESRSNPPVNLKLRFEQHFVRFGQTVNGEQSAARLGTFATLVASSDSIDRGPLFRPTSWTRPPLLSLLADYREGNSEVESVLTLRLANFQSNEVIAVETFQRAQPAVLDDLLKESARWTWSEIAAYWRGRGYNRRPVPEGVRRSLVDRRPSPD